MRNVGFRSDMTEPTGRYRRISMVYGYTCTLVFTQVRTCNMYRAIMCSGLIDMQ